MPDYVVKAGSADKSVVVFIFDPATGAPDTTVVFNTSGLDLQYRREGAASTAITKVTLAALTTAHTDGGFLHIGNGYYRLDLPDAAVAAGVTGLQVHGALTSRAIVGCYVHLVAYDPADTVRLGLTALPNVASGSAGAIPTTGTGANQIALSSGTVLLSATTEGQIDNIETDTNELQTDWTNGGRLDLIVDATLADTNELQTDWANGGRLDLILDATSTFNAGTDQVNLTTATQGQIDSIESSFTGVGIPFTTTGTPTTTSVSISGADLGDTNGDHNRQLCVFTSGGDGVVGVARWITTFTATGEGTGTLAFSGSADTPDAALPNAPSAGVTGIIVGRR